MYVGLQRLDLYVDGVLFALETVEDDILDWSIVSEKVRTDFLALCFDH